MILDLLANANRYTTLHPLFPHAFEFLTSTNLRTLAPGRYPIEGERLFAIVERFQAAAASLPDWNVIANTSISSWCWMVWTRWDGSRCAIAANRWPITVPSGTSGFSAMRRQAG